MLRGRPGTPTDRYPVQHRQCYTLTCLAVSNCPQYIPHARTCTHTHTPTHTSLWFPLCHVSPLAPWLAAVLLSAFRILPTQQVRGERDVLWVQGSTVVAERTWPRGPRVASLRGRTGVFLGRTGAFSLTRTHGRLLVQFGRKGVFPFVRLHGRNTRLILTFGRFVVFQLSGRPVVCLVSDTTVSLYARLYAQESSLTIALAHHEEECRKQLRHGCGPSSDL